MNYYASIHTFTKNKHPNTATCNKIYAYPFKYKNIIDADKKLYNSYVHEHYNVPKSITNLKYHAIYIIRIFLKVYLSDTKNEIFNYIKKYLYFLYLITRNQVKLLPTNIINLCENKRFIF